MPQRAPNNKLYAVMAIMAATLVLSGVVLFYVAYRGIRALQSGARAAASHAAAMADASIPPGKMDYVGEWTGPHTTLVIRRGSIDYTHAKGGAKESYKGALLGFAGDDIVINLLVHEKRLKVTDPPHLDGSEWVMTVDGERLVRSSP